MFSPERLSSPLAVNNLFPYAMLPSGGMPALYPFGEPRNLFRPISNLERVKIPQLRRFTRTAPVYSAIKQITDGVLQMPWRIQPPADLKENPAALQLAAILESALKKPNEDLTLNSYRQLTSAVLDDLLAINYGVIERQVGDIDRPFWLWAVNAAWIRLCPDWTPQNGGVVPKFIDWGIANDPRLIYAENAFMLINNVNSYEAFPPSPLEIAFNFIDSWLGVNDFQKRTTSDATQEWMIFLGNVNDKQVDAFREYWNVEVVQNKKKMIWGASGQPQVLKAGASDDQHLYHEYCEYLLRIIALCFSLSPRDANIQEHDNRATANTAADKSFASAVLPIAQTFDEGLDGEVVDFFAPGFRFKRTYTEPRSQAQVSLDVRQDFTTGIISRNEARIARGYDPVVTADGDVFRM